MKKSNKGLFGFFKNFFQSFLSTEAISSLFLLFFAGLALFMANSKWAGLYDTITHYPFSVAFGAYTLKANLHTIINEGLMSLFFFVVGMEVKRAFMEGELSSAKKAALPILAAIGGSLVPALIFFYFNQDLPTEKGWGIPMATDIAFAVGVMSLLSRKAPFGLKIFLLSVAIIDDIIAVLVIALFYSQSLSGPFIALAVIVTFCISLYFKFRLNSSLLLTCMAVALWFCLYHSGIHATLSGVILGSLIPYKGYWTQKQVLENLKKKLSAKVETSATELKQLKNMVGNTKSTLQRLISFYHPYVSYIIMPLFAFANAGIPVGDVDFTQWIKTPVSYGILLGLCLGKPVGIVVFSYLACFFKLSERPQNVTWLQIIAVGFLAGIGFTMSLFIMNLCFDLSSTAYSYAKLSIIMASSISAILGLILLSFSKSEPVKRKKSLR